MRNNMEYSLNSIGNPAGHLIEVREKQEMNMNEQITLGLPADGLIPRPTSNSGYALVLKCTKCGEKKTTTEFYRDKKKENGYFSACKSCTKAHQKKRYKDNPEKVKEINKRWYCKNYDKARASAKRWQEANPDRIKQWREENRDHLNDYNKQWHIDNREQRAAYAKERYAENRENDSAVQKRWREENPEKVKAAARNRRLNNPEKLSAMGKRWYYENRDRVLADRKKTHQEHPERRVAYASRRRARKQNAQGYEYTTADHIAARWEMWGGLCALCSAPAEHTDHLIPLAAGGSHYPANLRPLCGTCNMKRPRDGRDLPTRALETKENDQ